MSIRRIAASTLALASLTAGLLVPSAASATECTRGTSAARLIQPEGGQLSANTVGTGTIAYTIPGSPVPAVMVSTTGQIEVKIEHRCLEVLRLTVYKDGVAAPIHSRTWDGLACEEGIKTDLVDIGLDGGQYSFVLDGIGCDGTAVRSDGNGGLVIDPPLGV